MSGDRTTELLREGLTEHGIEWRSGLEGVTFVGDWCFVEYDNGRLAATCEPTLTPEQAIAATLDGGECELVYGENDHGDDGWWCQSCGGWFAASFRHTGRDNLIVPRYCQHCGKAVKR